ncbi:MAG: IS630 family transposase, partial [Methylocella sp.]
MTEARKLPRVLGTSPRKKSRMASRARIVLGAADGKSNNARVKERKTSRPAVPDWRRRLAEGGV